jgi:hypothetical protein
MIKEIDKKIYNFIFIYIYIYIYIFLNLLKQLELHNKQLYKLLRKSNRFLKQVRLLNFIKKCIINSA